MNKKGDVTLTLKEIWGLLKAAAMILIISLVFAKMFFFVNPTYASSKSNLERFDDVLKLLENKESRSLTLDFEKGTWLFGFNKDQNSIKYRRTDRILFRNTYEQSKPRSCEAGKACLCLCSDDCKKFTECKVFEDIEFFVVTDISDQLNGGISYEFDGEQGNYLAMSGHGVIQVDIWREKDVIYIGQVRPEKEQAREEFKRFVDFANKDINVRYPGTCKLVFEINITKLTQDYYIMIYADGNAKLFSGEGEQTRELAAEKIEKAPLLRTDFEDNEIDQIFEDYDTLQITDFRIPRTAMPGGADVQGAQKEITVNKIVLLQRDGKWIWTNYDPGAIDLCE